MPEALGEPNRTFREQLNKKKRELAIQKGIADAPLIPQNPNPSSTPKSPH